MVEILSINAIKLSVLGFAGFLFAFLLTPGLTHILYKYKLWRKTVRTQALGGGELPFFQKFHKKGEINTPRFGGILIWITPPALALIFFALAQGGIWWFEKLNFLNRGQTWLPLATLVAASGVGFIDDLFNVIPLKVKAFRHFSGGLSLRYRFVLITIIGLIGAWWFFYKLGWDTLHVPGVGDLVVGFWYIPIFVVVMLATYSGGVIDGLDGLSGGTFASIFAAFAAISFSQGQIDLAAFCLVITGALLAFLWFNIPPARFYMGETGMMGLTATVTVIAFLTDSVLVLPIIGFLLVAETASVIIQVLSKKLRNGKKVFLAAPIHHHFEAMGWPHYKVTMRFWLVGMVMAVVGVTIRLLG